MFICKERYLFLLRCINHYKICSDAFARRIDIDRKKTDELNSKFLHMRQSKIFWKNRCRELEEKIRDEYQQFKQLLVSIQKYISDNPVGAEQECFGREINDFIDKQIEELKKVVCKL